MAYRNLKTNKGSGTPGVDGMKFEDFEKISESRLVSIVQSKIDNYQPKAVRRVYIPKPNGKKRPLGIPTVLDRIVQQSVLQIMEPICEAKFHNRSYGFRPNRSTKNAVAMCYRLVQINGFHYVVDVDIKGFFDNVDHPKLLKQLWTLGVRDKNLLSLIARMLKAPIMEGDEKIYAERGTPQGGVLSPLLANVVLNELDWWIASQWEQMKIRSHALKLSKDPPPILKGGMDTYFYEKYKKSKQLRYINDLVIVPVAFCRLEIPVCHSPDINKYTRAGRDKIHKMLQKEEYEDALIELADSSSSSESIEFCDNRISRFVASKGKCEITRVGLTADEAVCHRLIPKSKGGTDAYSNLRIIHKEMEVLIYADNENTIIRQLKKFDRKVFNADAMKKINKWRNKEASQ